MDNEVQDHNQKSQELEAEKQGAPEVCLRCCKVIEHVPYKYLEQTFHAVCVICDFCGRKLLAKPFIIEGSRIFCTEKCKTNFEGASAVCDIVSSEHISGQRIRETSQTEPEGESLMEVLENIQEGSQELAKLSKKTSPIMNRHYDPDRLTDYPRARSPDPYSPNWSRRSSSLSLSAMSESSLTSDGSSVISYDANKQPKKKILKNPHRVRKSSKNRVRWNLPGEENDTSSLRSFDSVSLTSEVYNQAKSSVAEARRKWKTPEQNLSPAQLHHRQFNQSFSSSPLLNVSPSPSPSNSPLHYLLGGSPANHSSGHHARSSSTSNIPQIVVSKEAAPSEPQAGLHFPISPLTSSSVFSPSPPSALQSTPKPHYQSDSILSRSSKRETEGAGSDSPRSFDIDMPILRLDNSNLTDLEESTLEDRKKMHIFQFPQQDTPVAPAQPSPGLRRSVTAPPTVSVFFDDDDADDYDHLSPLHKQKVGGAAKPPGEKPGEKQEHASQPTMSNQLQEDLSEGAAYSDRDIEEALGAVGEDSDKSSHNSLSGGSSESEIPPSIQPAQNSGRSLASILAASLSEERRRNRFLPVVFEEIDEVNWQVNQASATSNNSREADPAFHVPDLIDYQGHRSKVSHRIVNGEDGNPVQAGKDGELGLRMAGKPDLVSSEHVAKKKSHSHSTARDERNEHHSASSGDNSANLATVRLGYGLGTDAALKTGATIRTGAVLNTTAKTEAAIRISSILRATIRTDITVTAEADTRTGATTLRADTGTIKTDTTVTAEADTKTDTTLREDATPITEASKPAISTKVEGAGTEARNISPQQVSPKNPRSKIPPPVPPKNFRRKKVPPPVPPKTKHIKRNDRNANGTPKHALNLPPMLEDFSPLSNDLSPTTEPVGVEDILPPPPEFAFSSPPQNRKNAIGVADQEVPFDEILASTSNSTLVPDLEESPERLILETDHHNERESSSSSSSPSSYRQNKHSWSIIHHQKVKERVEGHRGDIDALLSTGGAERQGSKHSALPSRGTRSLSSEHSDDHRTVLISKHSAEMALIEGNAIPVQNQSLSHSSLPLNSSQNSRRQGSNTGQVADMRTEYTSGNQGSHINPGRHEVHKGSNSGPHDTHTRDRGSQDSHTSGQESSGSLKRLPFRPAPPPPVPAKVSHKLSQEERHMLPLLYPSSGKPHMMKPVIHDTGKHIQDMLMEIETESRRKVNSASYGKLKLKKVCIWN